MANKTEYAKNTGYQVGTVERATPNADHEYELLNTPVAGTVYIDGMELTTETTVPSGSYKVDGDKIIFSADDEIENIEVIYDYVQEAQEAIITNKESAIGQCAAIWPVYGSGDDCTENSIVGYYVIKVFRARITQVPGVCDLSSPLAQQCAMQNFPNTEKLLVA